MTETKLKPYQKYKPSGVQWLGDIPQHWDVKRLKYIANSVDRKIEADEENPAPYIGLENIESWTGRLLPLNPDMVPTGVANAFAAGNLLFGKLRPYLAKAYIPAFDGLCSTELLVLARRNGTNSKFLIYLLLAEGFIKLVDSSTYGSKMPRANWDFIGSATLPLPSFDEQRAIAEFLDRETAKIDRLVEKQKTLIERLKEKRTALISHVVTKGLDPKVKMKPSGIPWLGDIPEHWEVNAISRISETIQTGPFGSQLHASDYIEGGIPLINPAHIVAGKLVPDELSCIDEATALRVNRHRLQEGDIVMARRGEIGRCGVVQKSESGWLCGTGSLVIRLTRCNPTYFATIISGAGFSSLLELSAVGTTMLNLNPTIIGRMLVPVPPFQEQQAIAAHLDRETGRIDALVSKVEQAIERLQEYRTALISEAVTGKIDVTRNVKAG